MSSAAVSERIACYRAYRLSSDRRNWTDPSPTSAHCAFLPLPERRETVSIGSIPGPDGSCGFWRLTSWNRSIAERSCGPWEGRRKSCATRYSVLVPALRRQGRQARILLGERCVETRTACDVRGNPSELRCQKIMPRLSRLRLKTSTPRTGRRFAASPTKLSTSWSTGWAKLARGRFGVLFLPR